MQTTFEILIDGRELPSDTFAAIEAGLTSFVLAELAKVDNHGDLVAERLPVARGGIGDGGGVRAGGFVRFS